MVEIDALQKTVRRIPIVEMNENDSQEGEIEGSNEDRNIIF